jgi:hypothetical protein
MGLGVTTILDIFGLRMQHIRNCAGELRIIPTILEAPVIENIPTHLGLQARAPPRTPASSQRGKRTDAADRDRSGDPPTGAAGVG